MVDMMYSCVYVLGTPPTTAAALPDMPAHWTQDTSAPSHFPEEGEWHEADVAPETELVATQKLLHAHPAFTDFDPAKTQGEEIPWLVAMGGQAYINDGHHRLAAAHAAGATIRCRVWSDPDEEF